MARLAGRKYWFILSVHLYYFVPNTIKSLLEQTGFEVVEEGPHFQFLELGYLTHRLEAYLPRIARMMRAVEKTLGVERFLIPYYAAQSRIMARKIRSI